MNEPAVVQDFTNEIERLLQSLDLFAMFEPAELVSLASCFKFETYSIGEMLFEAGDPGERLYIVLAGRIRVQRKGPNDRPITLEVLGKGELLGEGALLSGGVRSASARVADEVVLATLGRSEFDSLMADKQELRAAMHAMTQDRSLFNLVRLSAIGRRLPPRFLRTVFSQLQPMDVADGQAVINQGEVADAMYIATAGQFTAMTDGVQVNQMNPGDVFGERGLHTGERRVASVVASGKASCLRLPADIFNKIVGDHPELVAELDEHVARQRLIRVQSPDPQVNDGIGRSTSAATDEPEPESVQTPVTPNTSSTKNRRFKRFPLVRQHLESDCGAACLAMIGRWHGERYALTQLRDMANVTERGASMLSLARAADGLGFNARALKLDRQTLADSELPVILFWDGYHYVVLWRLDAKTATIGDPGRGTLTVELDEFDKRWSGFALAMEPRDTIVAGSERSMLRRILPMVTPYGAILSEILLASLVVALLGLVMPVFTQTILDEVLPRQDSGHLRVVLIGLLLVGVFTAVGTFVRQLLLIHVGQKLRLRLSNELFTRLLALPVSYFRKRRTSDVLARFHDNTEVQNLLTGGAVSAILDGVMVLVYLGLMLHYSGLLGGIALVYLVSSAALIIAMSPMLKRNNQKVFERGAATQGRLIEALANIDTIKASGAELPVRWDYENHVVDEARQNYRAASLGLWVETAASGLRLVVMIAVLGLGAGLVIAGDLTIGELIAFQALLMMSIGPVTGLVGMYQTVQDGLLSLERLSDIYDAQPEEPTPLATMPPVVGHIRLDSLTFGYDPEQKPILNEISVEIAAGQTVALIGRSGSGKSTLLALLQRFYAPDSGRVLIDGIDISMVSSASLRRQIGVVMQEPQLFSGTIRENIAYGYPEATQEQLVEAARIANAHDFIQKFPLGYDTAIGEVGVRLSGGQKQRIAIARAVLPQPGILFFDEATSALDTESERAIQQNLDAILSNNTALIVAHRLSTVQNADRILVLDDGAIIEDGNFDSLMQARGLFYYLIRQQISE